jgi:FkbM family methyltransferase
MINSRDAIINRMPLLHRFPFWYSWNGFRGSQFIWALFGVLKKLPDSKDIQLPNKFPLIVNEKDWISKTIYHGTYERSLLHFLDSLVLSSLMVDVGANIGVTLWHALRNSKHGTRYMAFEPSKQCLPGLLMATSHLHNEGQVFGYAIGHADGIQTMHGIENEMHSGGASLISHSGLRGRSEDVDVRKLDSLVPQYSNGVPISLLKIDTEGYESHVISGAKNILESGLIEIVIMEVSPNFGDVSYLKEVNQLLGAKYHWFTLEESGNFKRKPSLHKISLKQSLSRAEQWNLVLVRDDVFNYYCMQKHQIFLGFQNYIE